MFIYIYICFFFQSIYPETEARLSHSPPEDGALVTLWQKSDALTVVCLASVWFRFDWYLPAAQLWTRCYTKSSFMEESVRAFPPGPLFKIYPAPTKAVSCIGIVCFCQPRLYPKTKHWMSYPLPNDRDLVSLKLDCQLPTLPSLYFSICVYIWLCHPLLKTEILPPSSRIQLWLTKIWHFLPIVQLQMRHKIVVYVAKLANWICVSGRN